MLTRGDETGPIVRLQVQKIPIKRRGEGYAPEGLLIVDRAAVDAWGMVGWHGDAWVVDAHHTAHPSRRGGGRRQLSIGFTGHYSEMERRFGNAPIGIINTDIDQQSAPACSLEAIPYAYGFDADVIGKINNGDYVELKRIGEQVVVRVLGRVTDVV